MTPALPLCDEAERLAALRRYEVLDTPAEEEFDDLTTLAAQICGTPIALISLVDSGRQWFKSKRGLDAPETPRDISFCGHAIHQREIFEVPNAHHDARFHDNPLVTGGPNVCFYAGVPLTTADGFGIGTLCVIDDVPHLLTQEQRDGLAALGRHVMRLFEIRRSAQRVRQINADLTCANEKLEEMNRLKSQFLANMSHELRTPLNSIIGCSEMLKEGVLGALEAKQRDFATDIFNAGTHLLSLINDILDLSKVEAGMLQLEPDAVDVVALLKASTLVVREKAAAHRIRLDTRIEAGLGSMIADEKKVKQIVYNLLSNAVKFTPAEGAVTLIAGRCTRAEVALDVAWPGRLIALAPGADDAFLALIVEDSGVGIAEEDLQKLFEPFTQVDSTLARQHSGTGLGLALVRRLAELHGGTVGISSRPGAGSRFCVWLPWREAALQTTK